MKRYWILLSVLTVLIVALFLTNLNIARQAQDSQDIDQSLLAHPCMLVFLAEGDPVSENYLPYLQALKDRYAPELTVYWTFVTDDEEQHRKYNPDTLPATVFFEPQLVPFIPETPLPQGDVTPAEAVDGIREVSGSALGLSDAFLYGIDESGKLVYCKYVGLIDMVHLDALAKEMLGK